MAQENRIAVLDTSVILFIYLKESPASLVSEVISKLRSSGYRVMYPPTVEAELKRRGRRALETLNTLAERLPVRIHSERVAGLVDQWNRFLRSLPECSRRELRPLYCGVNRGDIAISLLTPANNGILLTGDRGQACFHAALRQGNTLLVPYEMQSSVESLAETKACRIEEDLDRIYFKIGRLIEGLRGRYREMALEVEGRIYVEGVSPKRP